MDKHYTVSQATEMTGVKAYVLRYWEDEMELRIGRNEMGHRYYTAYDIQLFLNIKELKNRGLQLRAIKELIPKIAQTAPGSTKSKVKLLGDSESAGEKAVLLEEEKQETTFVREENNKILEFQEILERLITQELQLQNEEEERCRSLDAAIRRQQLARKEAAAASEKRTKKERKLYRGRC
jgi:DNA-binding transcriptional MerR regulator